MEYMKDTELPFISIIVPVYNIEDYLEQCIQSIINQTYANIQIILVDDGSTDRSGAICDKYQLQDSRVEVIHKKNGGLVSARKTGVSVAKGAYVGFVDGDDWIETDMLQRMMEAGQGADVITCSCYEEYGDYQTIKKNNVQEGLYTLDDERKILYQSMFMHHNFYEFGIMPSLWSKLIKYDILSVNQIKVSNRISYGEDVACTYPCLLDASSIYVTNIPLYHYRQRNGSIVRSSTGASRDNIIDIYSLLKKKFDLLPCCREILQEQLHYYMWFILLVKAYEDINTRMPLFPFSKVSDKMRLVIYGAGGFGKTIKNHCDNSEHMIVVGWADLHHDAYRKRGLNVISAEEISDLEFDCIIIAILDEKLAEKIKKDFMSKGILEEKIDWVKKNILQKQQLPDWVNEL